MKTIGALLLAAVLGLACRAEEAGAPALAVTHTQNTTTVPPYEVFELTFRHENSYANPFFDVTIQVTFRSPSGEQVQVGGFHYGSSTPPKIETRQVDAARGKRQVVDYIFDKHDLWKARFAPAELGEWTYSYVFANAQGEKATGEGAFKCVEGRVHNHGFVRQNPGNPFRWVFDDGTPYFPIGLQDCWGDGSATGSVLDECCMEGPFRLDRERFPDPPPGAMFKPGPGNWPQNGDVYFRHFAQCGFDLYRFSQRNCSYSLYAGLDSYLTQEGIMTDELLSHCRKYGLRVFYGILGSNNAVSNEDPDNAEEMAKVKRFIKYSADRWGAYVDFWEFLNEREADDGWQQIMASHLRSVDPYDHPITSWKAEHVAEIDFNSPHSYYGSTANPDTATVQNAQKWNAHGKPVIVGEHGNSVNKDPSKRPPGHGGVWYPESALRMRIRNWVAFFNEIVFIFWNTSYARDGHYMNIWLGPQEREYVRAQQDFVYRLDPGIGMTPVTVSKPEAVRGWGLRSADRAAVYLYHFEQGENPVTGLTITLDVPQEATGYWYSPENAAILETFEARAGQQTLAVPDFTVDLALLITPDGPPDIDGDGLPNDADDDDDNDGVSDDQDAFPLEPYEWEDKDGDLIGDNMDADDDADGLGDDHNRNGTPDYEELDLDGDGVDKARCVPWDAFPFDPNEWRDTDGDGVGDNADTDDDGDGWSDEEEKAAGTDPLAQVSFPLR